MSWPSGVAALALSLGLLLSGCGFEPVYAKRDGERDVGPVLAGIAVAPIPDRVGQILRARLEERLAPSGGGETRLLLRVNLRVAETGTAIRRDDTATRSRIVFTARYELASADGGRVEKRGRVRRVVGHDVFASDYATEVARRDAERRAAEGLSRRIVEDLALHFRYGRASG